MDCSYNKNNKTLLIKLTEEIDHSTVEKIRNKADFEIEKNMPANVIVDFENVNFMDSAGIGFLLGRYKIAKMIGGTMNLLNVNASTKKILEMSGVLKIIDIINV